MIRTIEWKTRSGQQARVVVELITEQAAYADGWNVPQKCCELYSHATVDGVTVGYDPHRINHPEVAGRCGKLGIPAAQMDAIETAQREIKASPAWQAKLRNDAVSDEANRIYEGHCERMRQIMGY